MLFEAFLHLKQDFGGRRFDSDGINGFDRWCSAMAVSFYEEGIEKLVSRSDKCLNKAGNYVAK